MASISKLRCYYYSMKALPPCKLEDLSVWDQVLPVDAKQSEQAIDMESVLLPCSPTVDCPYVAGIN